jgi:hypothetical protein
MRISASFPSGKICSIVCPLWWGNVFDPTFVSLLDFLRSTFHTGRRDLRTIFRIKRRDAGGVVFVPILHLCGGNPLDLLPVVLIDLLGRR